MIPASDGTDMFGKYTSYVGFPRFAWPYAALVEERETPQRIIRPQSTANSVRIEIGLEVISEDAER
jgi:hypothetical protein